MSDMEEKSMRMINNVIYRSFREGTSVEIMIKNTEKRSKMIHRVIHGENLTMDNVKFNIDISKLSGNIKKPNKRILYAYYYIIYSNKIISKLNTITKLKKKGFFISREYTNHQLFDILKLKDKLVV